MSISVQYEHLHNNSNPANLIRLYVRPFGSIDTAENGSKTLDNKKINLLKIGDKNRTIKKK